MIEAHLPVLPVLLPLAAALVLLLIGDAALRIGRLVSLVFVLLGLVVALLLVDRSSSGELLVYRLGAWPAPFGIVLVIDRLAALMVLLVQLVALPVLLYASGGWDAHGRHFHALFQFQLMGLCGAFVTGDLFNLFVFFEVLLIASYVLLVHGHGRERFRFGVPYVVLNLVASALFLIGVAVLYAFTGTLNLADLSRRVSEVSEVSEPDAALLRSGALLLLVVFGFKAALAPLHLWLPATYAAASAPVAALFVLMTKVGVVAILRLHGAVFGEAGATFADWLLPLALLTAALGVLGALAAHTLARLIAWLNIASVATILIAVALWNAGGWSAALYYMAHSTLVVAALFLLAELVGAQRGAAGGRLEPASPVAQPALLGSLLLLAAASIIGLPPLPGFLGKLMILQAAPDAPVWIVVLAVGFVTLVGLARAGSILFWSVREEASSAPAGQSPRLVAATCVLLALGVAMAVAAAPIKAYTDAAALQLRDRDAYVRAVLGTDAPSVRPYPSPVGGGPGWGPGGAPSRAPIPAFPQRGKE